MKSYPILTICLLLLLSGCQSSGNQEIKKIEQICKESVEQYRILSGLFPHGRFPVSYFVENDSLAVTSSGGWVSGFYPGTLLYLYEETKDEQTLAEAERILQLLEKEQFNTRTHDIGFMMYCSFGNALRVAPKPEYHQILENSAKSLIERYEPNVGCIKSWDSSDSSFLVIIDNMMNLELLFHVSETTGKPIYRDIAISHADHTIQNHFRENYSSYHVVNYDSKTGYIIQKRTAQGLADESAWARGQAWGIYGYTMVYRFTKDRKYLDFAQHIADFILNHPNLPEDKIPYWDFDVTGGPRDASAAAIIASGLLELSCYVNNDMAQTYRDAAQQMLYSLSSDEYRAKDGKEGGFLLKHSVGNFPGNRDVNVPLIYADYYYIEALLRQKKLECGENLYAN
ncbi:MAG: glycoside hydrolase family 88 protein [Tannerella sp.]|jgi:hypothetical protein|nr:glycoside hydrolase family 88 protein [Tannerella sp.]